MPSGELSLALFCYLQPPVVGFILFLVASQATLNKTLFAHARASRKRLLGVRFFECATHPRLIGQLRYDIQALSLAAVFVLYDVDLFFFFSEVVAVDQWSWAHAGLFLAYATFVILGLWYDVARQGLGWTN